MNTSAPRLHNGIWKDGQFGAEAVPFAFETGVAFASAFLLAAGEKIFVDYPRRAGRISRGTVTLYGVSGGVYRRLPVSVGTPAALPEIAPEVWSHA